MSYAAHTWLTKKWWVTHLSRRSHRRLDGVKNALNFNWLLLRGGTSREEKEQQPPPVPNEPSNLDAGQTNNQTATISKAQPTPKIKHTFDLIRNLRSRTGEYGNDESSELRALISSRANEYIEELHDAVVTNQEKLPHPKKLLHYLAPKVPAIKHSPDVNLRIHSARSDMDSGVAACVIGTIAHVCEVYDKEILTRATSRGEKISSAAPELTTDRRFEQLVECVLSGVNVKKRKREALKQRLDRNLESADIEEILDGEDAQESDGLNVPDACRAAWGLAILGAHHMETLGDENVLDLLLALSLRIRELLLARLQLLRKHDLFAESSGPYQSTDERLNELAEELAEDAASAMWTFACVKACTGMRSSSLFEACCSILCQDPVELRKRAQDEYQEGFENSMIGGNDVIDRLARSEAEFSSDSMQIGTNMSDPDQGHENDALLEWLSPSEVNDIVWALALHGSQNSTSERDEITLSETASALREIAFDRILEWLSEDLSIIDEHRFETENVPRSPEVQELDNLTFEVVDAATLLAGQDDLESDAIAARIDRIPVEAHTARHHSVEGSEVQEVQVVDAAKLLASIDNDDPIEVETEVILAPAAVVNDYQSDERSLVDRFVDHKYLEKQSDQKAIMKALSLRTTFSPHDLACIAWSVTELRDSLRIRIVGIVIQLFGALGPTSLDRLNGSDLSNLAWAISRYEDAQHDDPNELSISILQWIARDAMKKIREHSRSYDSPQPLQTFQPPEIGRLLWAIACTVSTYSNVSSETRRDEHVCELALSALLVAGSNLSIFATEDLVSNNRNLLA